MIYRRGFESNAELVDHLVEKGYIRSEKVEEAFRKVDRADFLPVEHRDDAYRDTPLEIADNATISAPHMVAENTELLQPEEDSEVIEIGSGSGYQLAILSELSSAVTGVEINQELAEKSREKLSDFRNVEVMIGSGFEPVDGEFDRILFSCAIDSIDLAKPYLAEDGIAVAPVKQGAGQVMKKLESGRITEHSRVRFVEFQED